MPVADRLLPSGLLGDFLQRQGDLDETLQHFAVFLSSLAVTISGVSVTANW